MRPAYVAARPTIDDTVHAIVPDELAARRLASLVGAKEVSQLGALYLPPPKALTATQKHQRHEARKAIDALFELRNVPRIQPSPVNKRRKLESRVHFYLMIQMSLQNKKYLRGAISSNAS